MKLRLAAAAVAAMALTSATALADDVKVVTSIKPLHSLAAGVMAGIGTPELLIEGAGSPHGYSLKPSQAAALQDADLIVWVGPELETFLEHPMESIGADAVSLTLFDTEGLTKHEKRVGGLFEAHSHHHGDEHAGEEHEGEEHAHEDHDDDDHEKHADHDHDHDGDDHEEHAGHDHDDDHDHDGHEAAEHEHEHDHDDHDHGPIDAHIWLDPQNAKVMAGAIAEALAKIDPDNADTYAANAAHIAADLDTLTAEVGAEMKPLADARFFVFHDAYQSFEKRFGLTAAGSITLDPEVPPGAARLSEIKEHIGEAGATCVFTEPQFSPKLVTIVTEGTSAKSGLLDPLGAELEPGPELYGQLIRNLSVSFRDCLG